MTLYEYLSMHDDAELEIGDNTWDCMTNVYWDKNFKEAAEGTAQGTLAIYDTFMVAMYRHLNIIKLHDQKSGIVDITAVVRKFEDQLYELQSSIWWPAYCYDKGSEDFEYQWVDSLCKYMDGSGGDGTYQKLIDILEAERKRWLEAHKVEDEDE